MKFKILLLSAALIAGTLISCQKTDTQLESRVDTLEKTVSKINTLSENLEQLQTLLAGKADKSALSSVQEAVENCAGDLTALQALVDSKADSTDVASLLTKVGALQEILNGLKTSVGKLETDMSNVKTSVGNVESSVDAIETKLATIEDALDAVETSVDALSALVSSLFNTAVLTFVPEYADGFARVTNYFTDEEAMISMQKLFGGNKVICSPGGGNSLIVSLTYEVTPASAAELIVEWKDSCSISTKILKTKANNDSNPQLKDVRLAGDGLIAVDVLLPAGCAVNSSLYYGNEMPALSFSCNSNVIYAASAYTGLVADVIQAPEVQDVFRLALDRAYALMGPCDGDNYGLIPQVLLGNNLIGEVVSAGKYSVWNDLTTWDAVHDKDMLAAWRHAYVAIDGLNTLIAAIEQISQEQTDEEILIPQDAIKALVGEARGCRGFFWHYLATTHGDVPMLKFPDCSIKGSSAVSRDIIFDQVIDDMTAAGESLDWKPYGNAPGRFTKGAALAYLGDAYMWKAYSSADGSLFAKAKEALSQIEYSFEYRLLYSYSTLFDNFPTLEEQWNEEAIWQTVTDRAEEWADLTSPQFCGGKGLLQPSWEHYNLSYPFLDGMYSGSFDKRPIYSSALGDVEFESDYQEKYQFFRQWQENGNPFDRDASLRPSSFWISDSFESGNMVPAQWSTKYWRRTQTVGNYTRVYWKRYANVLLDLAECCFLTGDEPKGWSFIDNLRNRAYGNHEVGQDNSRYSSLYGREEYLPHWANSAVAVPDAKTEYTEIKYACSYSSEIWKVALCHERLQEFSCEPCLRADLKRSGILTEFFTTNYRGVFDYGSAGLGTRPDAPDASNPLKPSASDALLNCINMDIPIPDYSSLTEPVFN